MGGFGDVVEMVNQNFCRVWMESEKKERYSMFSLFFEPVIQTECCSGR